MKLRGQKTADRKAAEAKANETPPWENPGAVEPDENANWDKLLRTLDQERQEMAELIVATLADCELTEKGLLDVIQPQTVERVQTIRLALRQLMAAGLVGKIRAPGRSKHRLELYVLAKKQIADHRPQLGVSGPRRWATPTGAEIMQAAPGACWRRCFQCGVVGFHASPTVPSCDCHQCGSSDTRLLRPETEHLRTLNK